MQVMAARQRPVAQARRVLRQAIGQGENVSVTLIEHFENADPEHAWKVAFTNYMPREIVAAHHGGGSKA